MSWNYRIIKHEDGPEIYYNLHEVYYDDEGNPENYTKTDIGDLYGETPDEVIHVIKMMLKDATKYRKKILTLDDFT